jgi:hypothetical protein
MGVKPMLFSSSERSGSSPLVDVRNVINGPG